MFPNSSRKLHLTTNSFIMIRIRKSNSCLPFLVLLISLTFFSHGFAQSVPMTQAKLSESNRDFFIKFCGDCHGTEKQEGSFRFDDLPFEIATVESADRWQKVLNALNSGDMPPEDEPQPDNAVKLELLDELASKLVEARKRLADQGNRIVMRRLNRREYRNTIRDILGVEIGVRELPSDGSSGSFDTVGSSLFMSSDQFEQYLALGKRALDDSFARFVTTPYLARHLHEEVELLKNPKIQQAYQKRLDDRERYVQWTKAVELAANQSENIEILKSIQEEKKNDPTAIFFAWKRMKGAPAPTDFGFKDEVHADESGRRDWLHYVPHHRAYLELSAIASGTYLTVEDVFVNPYQSFRIPGDWPVGEYVVRVRIAAVDDAPKERRFVEFGSQHDSGVRAVASSHQITGSMAKPQILEIPIKLTGANSRGFFFQEKGTYESEAASRQVFEAALKQNGVGPKPAIWIDWIEVDSVEPAENKLPKKEHREAEELANRVVRGTYSGYYLGGYKSAKQWLASDRSKPPSAFGLTDEKEVEFRLQVFEEHSPSFAAYTSNPLCDTGAMLTIHSVHTEEVIALPPNTPSDWDKRKLDPVPIGEYKIRFRIGAIPNTPAERHFVELGSRLKDDEFTLLKNFQITGTVAKAQIIELPVSITTGGPRSFVIREKRDVKLDADVYQEARKRTGVGPEPALWIDWVEWEGPLASNAHAGVELKKLLQRDPSASDSEHARAVIQRFAKYACRDLAPDSAFVDRLVNLYESRRKFGDSFDSAIKESLAVVLASPGFLYLAESDPTSKLDGEAPKANANETSRAKTLTQREFAVRLSYFLWSAPPDEELLQLARKGDLAKAAVIKQQVDRLLDDPRAYDFITGFTDQWLGMNRLDFFQFNTKLYRDFDESTKADAKQEVFRTVENLIQQKASLKDLLQSNYVVVNGVLANYYGLDGVVGDSFRKVQLPADSPRGGLLGMAAILAMGSNGEHTSPVERGAWVLRKLLHDPPPPAPPNVPQLTRLEGKLLTTRERMMAHQEEPQCASCHRKIDPIGFGLENFNAAGKWRAEDSYIKPGVGEKKWEIDPAGAFHKGPAFKDFFELRNLIGKRSDDFARGFTEALIEYSLGRPYGFGDEQLATDIVNQAKQKDFAVREFIYAIVTSKPFRMK